MFAVPDNTIALAERPQFRHPVRVSLAYAADRELWGPHLRYDPDERFAALIDRDQEQEIWLLSWLPGQSTDLHDHEESTGAFTVVSGSLDERVVRRGPRGQVLTEQHELDAGQSRVFGPGYTHEIRNNGSDPAVSIHVYRTGGRKVRPVLLD